MKRVGFAVRHSINVDEILDPLARRERVFDAPDAGAATGDAVATDGQNEVCARAAECFDCGQTGCLVGPGIAVVSMGDGAHRGGEVDTRPVVRPQQAACRHSRLEGVSSLCVAVVCELVRASLVSACMSPLVPASAAVPKTVRFLALGVGRFGVAALPRHVEATAFAVEAEFVHGNDTMSE